MTKSACPECRKNGNDKSGDNLVEGRYVRNCFVCGYKENKSMSQNVLNRMATVEAMTEGLKNTVYYNKNLLNDFLNSTEINNIEFNTEPQMKIQGEIKALIDRGISEETCLKMNYQVGTCSNKEVHIMDYGNAGQKIRYENSKGQKKFHWEGRPQGIVPELFGIRNPDLNYDLPIFITEGEIDTLSLIECGFQACSLPDGADLEGKKAVNAINYHKEELLKFKEIIIFFDNDDAGKASQKAVIEVLPIDKVKYIEHSISSYKDANDYLIANVLVNTIKKFTREIIPEGLIYGNQLDIERLKSTEIKSIPLPWPLLNESMMGLEYGCLYMFLAGTSVGKSSLLRELAYYYRFSLPNLRIANFFLEENEDITPLAFAAIHNNIPLGSLRRDRSLLSEQSWKEIKQLLDTEHLTFINSRFNKSASNILKQIEYLVKVKKTDLIIIDHISYIIGRSGVSKHGERRDVDEFIYALQDLVQKLGCIVVAVSHVNESDSGKRWDQGEVPNIYSGRSSKVLAQVPDGIIGLARNMSAGQDKLRLYNLKNRWFSKLGQCDELTYLSDYGRLLSTDQMETFFDKKEFKSIKEVPNDTSEEEIIKLNTYINNSR